MAKMYEEQVRPELNKKFGYTNVMQAPKLTMFNGQTALLTVTDSQFFTTAVASTAM